MSISDWSLPKIDAHVHFNTRRSTLLEYGQKNQFSFLSINTDIPFFPSLDIQEEIILHLRKNFPGKLNYATSFPSQGWGQPGWAERCIERVERSRQLGAIGMKVWKNIGMSLRDHGENFILVDDPSLDPIFSHLESNGIPLLGHIGEPRNCWLPLEEMTVDQDRRYFASHPEYHMYLHPEYPAYEEHLRARNHLLDQHPGLSFVGLHLSSQEWNTAAIGDFLDRYPAARVDLAERICHLQHQAVSDPDKVRDFLINYQDRIIYGSDVIDDGSLNDEELVRYMDERYRRHWQFFTTSEMMSAPKVTGSFRAMDLPQEVVEKIYRENAVEAYGLD